MAYVCELGGGRRIYLDNQGGQTAVTIASSGAGQQQQASSRYQTGQWVAPPQLFQTLEGVAIKLTTVQGEQWLHFQGNSISVMGEFSSPGAAQQMQMQQVESVPAPVVQPMQPMTPMEPMQPMQPMKMGNMEMNMNPMQMRMGNMEMRMGTATAAPTTPSATRRFCSQCGAAVEPSDRFCSSCGHQLN
jgi:NADH pyrophosphatase NudC (nudix superfamily)